MRIILHIFLLGIFTLPLQAQKTVLDYYNLYQQALVDSDEMLGDLYPIVNKKGKYYTTSINDSELPVIVDLTNGYIQISDDGTGGGVLKEHFTIFYNNKKEPLFFVTESSFDGAWLDQEFACYRYVSNRWEDVSSKVLPIIKPDLCFDDTWMQKNHLQYDELIKTYFAEETWFTFELPQRGTTVIWYNQAESIIKELLTADDVSAEDKAKLKELAKHLGPQTREMPFNKYTSTFNFTE